MLCGIGGPDGHGTRIRSIADLPGCMCSMVGNDRGTKRFLSSETCVRLPAGKLMMMQIRGTMRTCGSDA